MSLTLLPTLDQLTADPGHLNRLPLTVLVDLRGRVDHLRAELDRAITLRLARHDGEAPAEGDRALTIEEAAQLLHTSKDTLYRKWRKLPFAYKDPVDGHIKFSFLGLQKHLRQRQGQGR